MFSTTGEEPGLARKNEYGIFHWLGSGWPQLFAWLLERRWFKLILSLSTSSLLTKEGHVRLHEKEI